MAALRNPVVINGLYVHVADGPVTLSEGVDRVVRSIAYCRDNHIPTLLVDVRGAHGFAVLTITDRFLMAEDFAAAARGSVRVAFVAPAEMIHPRKFAIQLANELGLSADVFESAGEARQWLLAPAANTREGEPG